MGSRPRFKRVVEGPWETLWRTHEELDVMYHMIKRPHFHGVCQRDHHKSPWQVMRGVTLKDWERFCQYYPISVQRDVMRVLENVSWTHLNDVPSVENIQNMLSSRFQVLPTGFGEMPIKKYIYHQDDGTVDEQCVEEASKMIHAYWVWRYGTGLRDSYGAGAVIAQSMFQKSRITLPNVTWLDRDTIRHILYGSHVRIPVNDLDVPGGLNHRNRVFAMQMELCIYQRHYIEPTCFTLPCTLQENTTYGKEIYAHRPAKTSKPHCVPWYSHASTLLHCIEHDFVRWFYTQFDEDSLCYYVHNAPNITTDNDKRVCFTQGKLYSMFMEWLPKRVQYQSLSDLCHTCKRLVTRILVNCVAGAMFDSVHNSQTHYRYFCYERRQYCSKDAVPDATTAERLVEQQGHPLLACAELSKELYIKQLKKRRTLFNP